MLFILLAVGAVILGAVVNAISGRPVLNGGRIGAVAVLALAVLAVGVSLTRPGSDTAGRRVGLVIGQALLPLLLCVYLDRRHVRNAAR